MTIVAINPANNTNESNITIAKGGTQNSCNFQTFGGIVHPTGDTVEDRLNPCDMILHAVCTSGA